MGVVDRLARVGVFGAVLAVGTMAATSAGCSRWREQSPSGRLARQYTPPATRPSADAPVVGQTAFASSQLEGLPAGVRTAFAAEHPSAAVTKVSPLPSGSGPMLYRISYLEDGVGGSGTYTAAGRDPSPAAAVVIRPDDGGRPKAKYAPKPEAGAPAQGTPSGRVD
ncbi:MAG: hypothetical protein JWO31_1716 [Phycisphaerales bacterium]|nr:hypothetical protein [Phycisphaerales bacterium]